MPAAASSIKRFGGEAAGEGRFFRGAHLGGS